MKTLEEILANIKLLVLDVDGVLTDGRLCFDENHEAHKCFHAQDGLGIKLLLRNDIQVAVISGRKSPIVENRLKQLGISHYYLGYEDKRPAWQDLIQKTGIPEQDIAYMGDDLPDIPLMQAAGLGVTVANAADHVSAYCQLQTKRSGGQGAVRELCDRLLLCQEIWPSIIEDITT